jgi:rhodanese-related sulfurtransferase
MNTDGAAVRRGETLRLAGACAGFLALAALLGTAVNFLRSESTRLPWVGDWEHHIETKAFRAGVPVVFLTGARERVNNPATVIFDARVPEQFEAGHLPRAHNLPVGAVDQRIGRYASLVTPETSILVYCGGADCSDALELAVKLREIGFKDLTLYPGGYAEWAEYGGTVNTGGEP